MINHEISVLSFCFWMKLQLWAGPDKGNSFPEAKNCEDIMFILGRAAINAA